MSKHKTIIALIGTSLSGKSTWANAFVKEHKNYKIVSRDLIRTFLYGTHYLQNQKSEESVTNVFYEQCYSFLKEGFHLILDETNLNTAHLNEKINHLGYRADFQLKVFPLLPLETLIERNNKRFEEEDRLIPLHVLNQQIRAYGQVSRELQLQENRKCGRCVLFCWCW